MEEKDADIVKRVLAGETAEFEKLVNRYLKAFTKTKNIYHSGFEIVFRKGNK